jgi:5'-3' exonuclease
MPDLKTVLLVDLSSIFWSSWHATKNKEVGEAFELTINKISRVSGDFDHVGICIDMKPYKRKLIYPQYKAQREEPSDAAVRQLKDVIDRLELDGYPIYGEQGAEADDAIASVWFQIKNKYEITILTGDKDLAQLVNRHTSILSAQTGEVKRVGDVVEKWGVAPPQMLDLLALQGDKSDNIPGVPDIGPVKAANLIKIFGSVPQLIVATRDRSLEFKTLSEKQQCNIFENLEQLKLSYDLVRLNYSLKFDLDKLFEPRVPRPLVENAGMSAEPLPKPKTQKVENTTVLAEPPQKSEIVEVPQTLVVRNTEWNRQLEPTNGEAAWGLAGILTNSRLYQRQFGSQEAILAIILRGRALNLDATTALESFFYMEREGKIVMSAHTLLGLVMRSNLSEYFHCTSTNNDESTWETKRVGNPGPSSYTYTIAMAEKAKIVRTNGPWETRPDDMIRKTAGVSLARMVYPDVVGGLYSHEEMGGI